MEEREYWSIYAFEETHWWYAGLRRLVHGFARRILKGRQGAVVLDAGCGAGLLLKELEAGHRAVGVDYSDTAVTITAKRGVKELVRGSVERLPFRASTFDLVVSLDVIYHSGVADDVAAMREMKRVLKPGGAALINVPAFEFLRGPHDRVAHTRERYTRAALARRVEEAGLVVERLTCWNAFLFPAIALLRLTRRLLAGGGRLPDYVSDLGSVPRPLNMFFLLVLKVENFFQLRMNLPLGTSVFCVARKR